MDDWVKFTQAIANAAQAVGIMVGGAWVYFKFLRGRTFAHRAEVDLEASLVHVGGKSLIKAKATLKNDGLSKVPLRKDFKWVEMAASTAAPELLGANMDWEPIVSLDVFTDHGWVESQETISDEVLFPVPEGANGPWRAFHLQVQVWSERSLGHPHGTRWVDNTIVLAKTEP